MKVFTSLSKGLFYGLLLSLPFFYLILRSSTLEHSVPLSEEAKNVALEDLVVDPALGQKTSKTSPPPLANTTNVPSLDDTSSGEETTTKLADLPPSKQHELTICELCEGHTPMSMWIQNIRRIFNASQHPQDVNYEWHDATAVVLKLITPRLLLGQRSFPRDWKTITALMRKADNRYRYLKDQQAGIPLADGAVVPPPIKILVFGGSVTLGHNCWGGTECSWPTRLLYFVDWLVGNQLVEVHNLAQSASDSSISQAVIEFNLLPSYAQSPDIIINNHGPNDSVLIDEANQTRRERMFDHAQEFVRSALNMCTTEGTPPLLLWIDDYLGNYHRQIKETTDLSQQVQVLANHYGFGFISYADMVRDLVYSKTTETTFSPNWYYSEDSKEMVSEVHPGTLAHLTMSYLIAYYLLQIASNYCSLDALDPELIDISTALYNVSKAPGLPTLLGQEQYFVPPGPRLAGLPPRLDSQLNIEKVTEMWENASQTESSHKDRCSSERKCPFFWLSKLPNNVPPAVAIKQFEPFIVQSLGWTMKGADGFMPEGTGATLTLKFDFEQEINKVVIFYLRSHTYEWANSILQVLVQNEEDTTIQSCSLNGFHGKRTTEMYVQVMTLPEPQKQFHVVIEHKRGVKSALLGFAVCS